MKLLRPVEGFVVLLAPIVLFKLIIDSNLYRFPLLVLVSFMLVVTGGKGAILAFLLPITAAQLIGKLQLNKRKLVIVGLFMVGGIAISILINYGASSLVDVISIFCFRLMMEGDIYILALAKHGIDNIEVTSLLAYVFGPILKAMMLPIEFDQHIGSQIASAIAGFQVPTGPNGHWPVLLMAFGFEVGIWVVIISFVFFLLVILLKLLLLSPESARRIPMSFAIPIGSFVIQFPQTFFADPPFQSVYLVHAVFVSAVLSAIFFYIESTSFRSVSHVPS